MSNISLLIKDSIKIAVVVVKDLPKNGSCVNSLLFLNLCLACGC